MGADCVHFVITDHCVKCRAEDYPPLQKGDIITITDMPPLNGTYKVKRNKNGTIELELDRGQTHQ